MQRTEVIGNIGKDAEVRVLDGGSACVSFSLAANEKWKDKNGTAHERTTWYRCTQWGDKERCERLAQFFKKGTALFVAGKISASAYLDSTGNPAASLELNIREWHFTGGKRDGAERSSAQPQPATEQADHIGEVDDLPF